MSNPVSDMSYLFSLIGEHSSKVRVTLLQGFQSSVPDTAGFALCHPVVFHLISS